MNYRQTPPIQLIPAFEATARLLSFKKAAEELCVTAPAVGQKVRALEDWLQKPLFERHTRRISLTPEGEFYFEVAQRIMQAHWQGYIEYTRRYQRSALRVSAPLFVAQELIMPRYLTFRDHVPDRELRLEARMSLVDFDVEPIDAAVRFGDGNWPGLACRKLCDASVAPVCSPSYASEHDLTALEELHKHRLIDAEPEMVDWVRYFSGGNTEPEGERVVCDSYLAALKAASEGIGVALGIFPTANEWVNSNRLVLPFPVQFQTAKSFWLVAPDKRAQEPEFEGLYRWLKAIFDELPPLKQSVTMQEGTNP